MNKTLAITAIVLIAVIMGMSALAPASATTPPAHPPGDEEVPTVDECEEIRNSNLPDREKDRLLELAGCN